MPKIDDPISVSAAARGSGLTAKTIYGWIRTGRLEADYRLGRNQARAKFVSRAAVEALAGRPIDEALPPPKPKSEPFLDYKMTGADIAFLWRAMAEQRDLDWTDACERARVKITTPRLPSQCRLDTRSYSNFTQAHVYELLANVAAQRDLEWRSWADDPLYRAKFPAGPPQFQIADLSTTGE